jgi:WD40 repeat protein
MLYDWPSPSGSPTTRRRTLTCGLPLAGLLLVAGLVAVAALLKSRPIDRDAPQPVVHTEGLAAAFLRSAAFGGEASRAVVQLGHRHETKDFRFLGEGRDLLTRASGEEIILWDALTGKRARMYDILDSDQSWTDYVLSPEGRYLITRARGGEDVLWDARAGRRMRTVFKRLDPEQSPPVIVISPDSRTMLLATADPEFRLELQSVESGELLRTFDLGQWTPVRSLRFSDDGLYIIGHQTLSGNPSINASAFTSGT